MTLNRTLHNLFALGAGSLLFACSPKEEIVVDTSPDEDTEETGDTAGDGAFNPTGITMDYASFGVDMNTNTAITVTGLDDTGTDAEYKIQFALSLVDGSINGNMFTITDSCTVIFEHDGPIDQHSWSSNDDDIWFGFFMPSDSTIFTDCTNYVFDSSWGMDPVGELTKWTWGPGLNDLDSSTRSDLEANTSDFDEMEDFLVGGGFNTNLPMQGDSYIDTGYSTGIELDEDFFWVLDGTDPAYIPAFDVPQGDGVLTGSYFVSANTVLTAGGSPIINILSQTPEPFPDDSDADTDTDADSDTDTDSDTDSDTDADTDSDTDADSDADSDTDTDSDTDSDTDAD